jgi:membrane protease YdiL (CAAX protease family)
MIWAIAGGRILVVDLAQTISASALVLAWCAAAWREIATALRRVPHVGWFALAAVGALATFAVASAAVAALKHLVHIPQVNYTDAYFDADYGWLVPILTICVQPAVIEELAFRGVIFAALRRVLDPSETVLVSALMFMILHLAVPSFPHLFLIGLILGWLRNRTGSLYPGMLLHFTHNLLCVLAERGVLY